MTSLGWALKHPEAYIDVRIKVPGPRIWGCQPCLKHQQHLLLLLSEILVMVCHYCCRLHLRWSCCSEVHGGVGSGSEDPSCSETRPTLKAFFDSSPPRAQCMAPTLMMTLSREKRPSFTTLWTGKSMGSSLTTDHQRQHLWCWCCNPQPLMTYLQLLLWYGL